MSKALTLKKTLVSSVGVGRKNTDQSAGVTYETTRYMINGALSSPTPFFVSAWLAHDTERTIDRVELVGSPQSSWSALLEHAHLAAPVSDPTALWVALEEAQASDDLSALKAHLTALDAHLSAYWGRAVRCHVMFDQSITPENTEGLISDLLSLFPLYEPKRGLVIDTTHGFRTLPLIVLSAAQVGEGFSPGLTTRMELIYGEYSKGGSQGYNFTPIQENLTLARALSQFEDTLDATLLAERLAPDFPKLADALMRLSDTFNLNLYSHLNERLSQLRNQLHLLKPDPHSLMSHLHAALARLVRELSDDDIARQIYQLARLRAAREQYGAALFALAEAGVALACGGETLESYEAVKVATDRFRESLRDRRDREVWRDLFQARNRVAHGGGFVEQNAVFTDLNIHLLYERAEELVRRLLERGR